MAKIATYTAVEPAAGDLLIGTDSSDTNATKNFTAQSVADLAGGGLKNVTVRVGSGDMNNLDTVAVNIIDAPGAGKAIQIVSASIKMDFNATAYSFTAPLQLIVQAGLPQMTILNTVVNVSTDVFSTLIPIASGFIAENSAVKLTTSAPSSTVGDSDVDLDLLYRIITV